MKNWKIERDWPAEVVTAMDIFKSVIVVNWPTLVADSIHYYGQIENSKVWIAVVETMMKIEVGAMIASS